MFIQFSDWLWLAITHLPPPCSGLPWLLKLKPTLDHFRALVTNSYVETFNSRTDGQSHMKQQCC